VASSPSRNAANGRALTLARRPVGNTVHNPMGGKVQSRSSARTIPLCNSGANIHSEVITSPRPASTASRTPSAAVTRTRPLIVTAEGSHSQCDVDSRLDEIDVVVVKNNIALESRMLCQEYRQPQNDMQPRSDGSVAFPSHFNNALRFLQARPCRIGCGAGDAAGAF
jgi:hypothetical protein